jgi:carboxyl-terminal processing protease
MRLRLATILLTVVLSATLLGGFLGGRVNAETALEPESEKLLKSFSEILATVQANYAEPIASDKLVESAVRGMLRTLDPHSSFFSTQDYDRLQEEQKGKYFGLGITIRPESPGSGRVVVVEPPAPGTPAYKAGLRAGDVIAKIEGEPVDEWDVNTEVIPNLKGPQGTAVNITVERPGEPEPLPFRVIRDEIPLYTIKYAFRIRPGIGYIRIARFAETTGRELEEALAAIEESTLDGLVLDLRDNPGGALSQALEVSEKFLDRDQKIVATRSRNGKENRDYRARRNQRHHYPMTILINQNSASASEIVSGALQDHDRALILGESSFGKALVQTIFPLQGNRGLALTTGKYYTPSDRLIQRSYSGSFWDYYNHRRPNEPVDQTDQYFTDGGRVVFGGGGINPDEVVKLDRIPRIVRTIQRGRNQFREYASRVSTGAVQSDLLAGLPAKLDGLSDDEVEKVIRNIRTEGPALEAFKRFVVDSGVQVDDKEWQEAQSAIANFLKQELLLLLVGDEASYRVAMELDRQVQTAIERLPQVMSLLARNSTSEAPVR